MEVVFGGLSFLSRGSRRLRKQSLDFSPQWWEQFNPLHEGTKGGKGGECISASGSSFVVTCLRCCCHLLALGWEMRR